jgi:trans-aconitate methyltransferase
MKENDGSTPTEAVRFNRDAWSGVADVYDERFTGLAHEQIIRPMMRELAGSIAGTEALCLGCGTGHELRFLADQGARKRTGIDFSREMLSHAARRDPYADLVLADLNEFDFGTRCYDLVWAQMALQYVNDLDSVLMRIHRALVPGGAAAMTLPDPAYFGAKVERMEPAGQRRTLGYQIRRDGPGEPEEVVLFGDCFTERLVDQVLNKELVVKFWVRPLDRVFQAAVDAGFVVEKLLMRPQLEVEPEDDHRTVGFKTAFACFPFVYGIRLVKPKA